MLSKSLNVILFSITISRRLPALQISCKIMAGEFRTVVKGVSQCMTGVHCPHCGVGDKLLVGIRLGAGGGGGEEFPTLGPRETPCRA